MDVKINFVDSGETIKFEMPENWTEMDIRDLVGQLVDQGNQRMYFGQVEATPRYLGNVDFPEDADTQDLRGVVVGDGIVMNYIDAFKESQHPRGQPENKGEFAKGGSKGNLPAGGVNKGGSASGSAQPSKPAQQAKKLPIATPPGQGAAFTRAPEDRNKWPPNIRKLVVPPAWSNVHYNPNPEAALLVTGQAQNGKWQPIYHPRFKETQAESKFDRVKEFDQKFPQIKAQNDKARKSKDPVTREHADVAALIMEMGLRPGGTHDESSATSGLGATDLQGKHVVQTAKGVCVRFVPGKSHGVQISLPVTDPDIGNMLVQRAATTGKAGALFPNVSAGSLLKYFHSFDGGHFKTKDARTRLGTLTAVATVAKTKAPTNPAEYKKATKEVATVVSKKLGNTPAVCLSGYINPSVFAQWRTTAGV